MKVHQIWSDVVGIHSSVLRVFPATLAIAVRPCTTVSPDLTRWADADFPRLPSLPCLISVALFLTSQSLSLCPFLVP